MFPCSLRRHVAVAALLGCIVGATSAAFIVLRSAELKLRLSFPSRLSWAGTATLVHTLGMLLGEAAVHGAGAQPHACILVDY